MLLAAGMSVSTVTYECDGVPEDEVISQTPAGGVLVTVGTQVTLVVSSGPCPPQTVSVPDLVGQNQISAVSRLISSGLQVGTVTQECSDTIAGGTVIRQDPPAGAELQSGAPVQLTVSSGPCEADSLIVPDVVGQNQLAAAGMLLSAGAQIGAIVLQCSGTAVAGTVISQEPASGTRVGLGTAVDLTVSSGPCGGSGATPETVLVPDVTGLNEYEARQVLQEAGLNASAGLYVFSDAANPGVVLTQSPLSGVEVSYGATVMLQISRGRSPFAPSDGDILNVLYD
ncbi:MAG TPA: PASTA domain-containing protein, partial [Candidatus Hydrogenedentes bacterium]|nr:PASTA domain-containing protein [Candidatus Hydrogenedentota bacterium]